MFGTLADFDALLAAVHDRGMKLVMDLVVNHTSDEHPWFVESRSSPRQPEARLVLVAPGPRRAWTPASPGPSRPTGARSSPARPGSSTRRPASTTCTCSRRKQPDLNWENPEVRAGGLRDDALVARPRRRRLPDGRHQHDLQGHRAARRPRPRRRPATATARRTSSAGRGSTSSCRRCTARCSPAATASCSPSARCPGVTVEEARLFTDPARGRGRHGLPVRARRRSTRARPSGTCTPLRPARPQGVARPLAGRPGRRRLEQPLLEQPRPAAGRLAVRRRRRAPGAVGQDCSAPCCTCTAARRTSTRARSSGMTNAPFAAIDDFRDIESLNHYADAVAPRRRPGGGAGRRCATMSRDNARTPMQWDASAERRLHAPARRGCRSTRTTPRSTPRPRVADPDSVFHHYRRLIALRHDEPAVALRRLHHAAARPTARSTRSPAGSSDVELLVLGNVSGSPAAVDAS